jgi:O-antigen/teichoic acid export membrane protein
MKRALLITAIDEALLSALSFGLSLALIHWSGKVEFGLYTLVTGIVLLIRGVQNAVILVPMTTNGSRLVGEDRGQFIAAVRRIQRLMGLVTALVLGVALLYFAAWPLAASATVYAIGTWAREFQRNRWLLDARNTRALGGDLVYVLACAVGIALFILETGTLDTTAALWINGAAALLPGTIGLVGGLRERSSEIRPVVRLLVDQGRWSLPGMAVTWAQQTGYAYLVSIFANTAAVGALATARLFIMPVMLLVTAWSRIFLPKAGLLLREGNIRGVDQLAYRGTRIVLLLAAGYLAAVVVAFELGAAHLLSHRSDGIDNYVLGWAVFAVVAVIRGPAGNALIAQNEFKTMFVFGVSAAVASLATMLLLVPTLGPGWSIAGAIAGELLLAILCWRSLKRAVSLRAAAKHDNQRRLGENLHVQPE